MQRGAAGGRQRQARREAPSATVWNSLAARAPRVPRGAGNGRAARSRAIPPETTPIAGAGPTHVPRETYRWRSNCTIFGRALHQLRTTQRTISGPRKNASPLPRQFRKCIPSQSAPKVPVGRVSAGDDQLSDGVAAFQPTISTSTKIISCAPALPHRVRRRLSGNMLCRS